MTADYVGTRQQVSSL